VKPRNKNNNRATTKMSICVQILMNH